MRLFKAIAGALVLFALVSLLLWALFALGPAVLIPAVVLLVFSFAVFVFYDIQGQS